VGIVLSEADPAGVTLLQYFEEAGFSDSGKMVSTRILERGAIRLLVLDQLLVPAEPNQSIADPATYPADLDGLAASLGLDCFVLASRHWAKSANPSLTVHPSGNFGEATYGGRSRELQFTNPKLMRSVYTRLLSGAPPRYSVSLEATHHSPTHFKTPMFFAELGSSEKQWRDPVAAAFLAETILKGVREPLDNSPVAVGFGGGHYCPKFSDLERDYAFGHICPKYALDLLDERLIREMVEKTGDGVDLGILEKNLKERHASLIRRTLKELDLDYLEA